MLSSFIYRHENGIKPLLLLDDIFDKLDTLRVSRIVGIVSEKTFGQVFITDTNRLHIDEIIKQHASSFKIFVVDEGVIKEVGV